MGVISLGSEVTQISQHVGKRSPLSPWTEPNRLGSLFLDKTPFCRISRLESDMETHLSINVHCFPPGHWEPNRKIIIVISQG